MARLTYLSPREVSRYVTFERRDFKWTYQPQQPKSMSDHQAEGTADIWNLLQQPYGLALLADEVGLGKTIQALAACALLWRTRPFARVLVIAPRQVVAENWLGEYTVFVRDHYKQSDDIVKSSLSGEPINGIAPCTDLYHLCRLTAGNTARLLVAKTTSFSYLTSRVAQHRKISGVARTLEREAGIDPDFTVRGLERELRSWPNDDRGKQARGIAAVMRDWLIQEHGGFDLLIIDEAHYYRTFHGESQKVNAAISFFGAARDGRRISPKTILLTATPNHSSSEDIRNIVRYFSEDLAAHKPREILQKVGLRRLRLLADRTKYEYRQEIPGPVELGEDPLADLFFGWYLRRLVAQRAKSGEESGLNRIIFGYMEGYEFIPGVPEPEEQGPAAPDGIGNQEAAEELASEKDEAIDNESKDFHKAEDSDLLQMMSTQFADIFGTAPNHPKYNKTLEVLLSSDSDLFASEDPGQRKALIFVRRIASAKEISRRYTMKLDRRLADHLKSLLGPRSLADLQRIGPAPKETDGYIDYESEPNESPPDSASESTVLGAFRQRKSRTTAGSRFARLLTNARSPFSLFFELPPDPAEPWSMAGGFELPLLQAKDERRTATHYRASSMRAREEFYDRNEPLAADLLRLAGNIPNLQESQQRLPVENLWTAYWSILASGEDPSLERAVRTAWIDMTVYEREGLAGFVSAGVRLASPSIVDLYVRYVQSRTGRSEVRYEDFMAAVKQMLPGSWLFRELTECILTFQTFVRKVWPRKDGEILHGKWERLFGAAAPAYGYTAGTKNESVRRTFNTPFFPYVLVATSVLQEGVNLQYFCNRVLHYGIAWTPGDNEQRVGRIDRRFGLLEREFLANRTDKRLEIHYPVLMGTLDEMQVSQFLFNLKLAEAMMDQCLQEQSEKEFDPSHSVTESMERLCLTKPPEKIIQCPYPVRDDLFDKAVPLPSVEQPPNFRIELRRLFADLAREVPRESIQALSRTGTFLGVVNVPQDDGRRDQPVVAEVCLWPEMTNRTEQVLYLLVLTSPLFSEQEQDLLCSERGREAASQILRDHPMVQLVLDEDKSGRFRIHGRVSLPLFRGHDYLLNAKEIVMGRNSLALAVDGIERKLEMPDYRWKEFIESMGKGRGLETTVVESVRARRSSPTWGTLGPGWKVHADAYYMREQEITPSGMAESSDSWFWALTRMGHYPMVQWLPVGNRGRVTQRIAWPRVDFQPEERHLIEEWEHCVTSKLLA